MTFYLGRPGSLVALPHPGRGIDPTLSIPLTARQTISGGRTVDRAPAGRRTYELTWASLSPDQHSIVEEFYVGAKGFGPFALIDPWRRNLLTANQSAATSVYNTTDGFTVLTGTETLTSVTTPVERGPRALAWSLPATVTGGVLTAGSPNPTWPGIPVVVGRSYRYQVRVRGGGTDPIVDLVAALRWLDAAGANLSLDSGSTATTSSGAWATASVTATCPAGGVYVLPRVVVNAATVTATATIYVDKPQLSMPTTADPGTSWALGTGVPAVSCTSSGTGYRKPVKRSADLTLAEVG